eukprot:512609-Pelagomonas_calceolata.AAC.1
MDDADELVLNLDYDVAKKPKVRYDCCKGMHTSSPEGEHAGSVHECNLLSHAQKKAHAQPTATRQQPAVNASTSAGSHNQGQQKPNSSKPNSSNVGGAPQQSSTKPSKAHAATQHAGKPEGVHKPQGGKQQGGSKGKQAENKQIGVVHECQLSRQFQQLCE